MKTLCLTLALVVLIAGAALAVDKPVKVTVDGSPITINPPALSRDGKTFIPLRSGTEAMGAHVRWNPNTQTATVTMCGQIARIKASDGVMIDNSLYLPLRMMSTELKCTVKWDPLKNTVFIEKPKTGG
jgi:hypothetical protein